MTQDYSDLEGPIEWIDALGLDAADGPDVALLPVGALDAGSKETIAHSGDAATVRKILQEHGIEAVEAGPARVDKSTLVKKDASWIGPVIVIGTHFLSQNPLGVEVVLKAIAAYVAEFVLDYGTGRQAKIEIVVKDAACAQYRKVTYKGPVSGIEGLAKVVKEARRGS